MVLIKLHSHLHFTRNISTQRKKQLIENGASLQNELFVDTIPPLEVAKVKENEHLVALIEEKIAEEKAIKNYFASYFKSPDNTKIRNSA
jgi:hypothetical protein